MVAYEVHALEIRVRLSVEHPRWRPKTQHSGLRHGFTLSTTPGITEGVIDNQPFDMELVARRPLKNK